MAVGKSVTDLANEVLDRIYKEKNGTPDEEEEEEVVDDEQKEVDGDIEDEGVEYGVEQAVEPILRFWVSETHHHLTTSATEQGSL